MSQNQYQTHAFFIWTHQSAALKSLLYLNKITILHFAFEQILLSLFIHYLVGWHGCITVGHQSHILFATNYAHSQSQSARTLLIKIFGRLFMPDSLHHHTEVSDTGKSMHHVKQWPWNNGPAALVGVWPRAEYWVIGSIRIRWVYASFSHNVHHYRRTDGSVIPIANWTVLYFFQLGPRIHLSPDKPSD